jgi:hypothetical protein
VHKFNVATARYENGDMGGFLVAVTSDRVWTEDEAHAALAKQVVDRLRAQITHDVALADALEDEILKAGES